MRRSTEQAAGSGAGFTLSPRELAFVAFVLVVPIPLLAAGGLNVPLPAIVERAGLLVFGGHDGRSDSPSARSTRPVRVEAVPAERKRAITSLGAGAGSPITSAPRIAGAATPQRRFEQERDSRPAPLARR